MLFTAIDPISPPHVLALLHALRAVDPRAEVHIDATGRQARIEGDFSAAQAADALGAAGLSGVVTRVLSAASQDGARCGRHA